MNMINLVILVKYNTYVKESIKKYIIYINTFLFTCIKGQNV